MWRLGRHKSLYCALVAKTRTRGGVKGDSSEGDATLSKPLVFIIPAQVAPQWLIGMCAALRGKTRADGEPASVTDEEPALNSAGHCDPVD